MAESLRSFSNALGAWLRTSAAPTSWFGSPTRKAPLIGAAGSDALFGTGGGARLAGLGGDDTYHLWDIADRVVEEAAAGVDTIVLHGLDYAVGYALPAHVENIFVEGHDGRAVGNALDNLVEGGDGRQWLNGAGGNDVLTGGAGADVFVFEKGGGMDVVTDFQPGEDAIVIGSGHSALTDLTKLTAAMVQAGTDVVLQLGGGDGVLFRNLQISDFTSSSVRLPFDTSALRPTFAEEFNEFRVSSTGFSGESAVWRSTYWWGRTIPTNNEAEFYSDSSAGTNPFNLRSDGVLDITAAPAANLPNGLAYTSGLITSQAAHVQTYGYFEMRARLPSGQGAWPAFWLLPANGDWPPEIDVMEMIGSDTTYLHLNAHSKTSGAHTITPAIAPTADLSADFNTFAVSWRPDMIRWYLNGTEVHSAPTPVDMHRPMYMLANLAIGGVGSWPGPTDGASPAVMSIDFIRAYEFRDIIGPVPPAGTAMAVFTGTSASQTLSGGEGADRIRGGQGTDTLSGGTGADVFVFTAGDGSDRIRDFQIGVDKLLFLGTPAKNIITRSVQGGLEVAYGRDKVLLAGVGSVAAGDIVAGAAEFQGAAGSDLIDRTSSKSWLTINGGGGNDTIRGGSGQDWIEGGTGDDLLRGGAGADSFVFRPWDGDDRIDDFQPGVDHLVFMGVKPATVHANFASIGGKAGIEVNYGQASAGTTVDHGTSTDSIFLAGVTMLAQGDLVFA